MPLLTPHNMTDADNQAIQPLADKLAELYGEYTISVLDQPYAAAIEVYARWQRRGEWTGYAAGAQTIEDAVSMVMDYIEGRPFRED